MVTAESTRAEGYQAEREGEAGWPHPWFVRRRTLVEWAGYGDERGRVAG